MTRKCAKLALVLAATISASEARSVDPARQAVKICSPTTSACAPVTGSGGVSLTLAGSVVDANNTTTAVLGAGGTFTGIFTDVTAYSQAIVLLTSDQSSATNGVMLEFSNDGITPLDSSVLTFTAGGAAPNAGQGFIVGVRGRFFRVVYVNGATPQGSFTLQTILSQVPTSGDILDLAAPVSPNSHAQTVRAVITGKTTAGGGSFVDVKVNPSGALAVAPNGADADGATQSTNPIAVSGLGFNGAVAEPRVCDRMVYVNLSAAAANQQVIAGVASQKIYVCGYQFDASVSTTATTLRWIEGTGAACASGPANVSAILINLPTSAPTTPNVTFGPVNPAVPYIATAGDSLCLQAASGTNAVTVNGWMSYTQN